MATVRRFFPRSLELMIVIEQWVGLITEVGPILKDYFEIDVSNSLPEFLDRVAECCSIQEYWMLSIGGIPLWQIIMYFHTFI